MPKWMDDCVKKYRKENPDASKQSAWAICTAAYKKEFGKAPTREDITAISLMEQKTLTFSTRDKERILARAVREKYIEMSDDPYAWPSAWIIDVYDDQQEVTVSHNDRMYAIPYSFVDQWTAELGEPYEVVYGAISVEAESVLFVLTQSWVGEPLEKLDDGDFAWLSQEYQDATEEERAGLPSSKHRQLPFAVHGKVSERGWCGAWKLLQFESYLRPVLRGGPSRKECEQLLMDAKPADVVVDATGACAAPMTEEDASTRSLTESYKSSLVIESAEPGSGFDFMISGAIVPAPETPYGTYSKNRRLYPQACTKESYRRSLEFLKEDVATIHTSHTAAHPLSGRMPVGKVTELWMEGQAMKFRGGVADTSDGRDLRSLIESGVLERVSLRTHEWQSKYEEVGDLGRVEVMEWFVLHGIDFTEVAGLDGTKIKKEERDPELDLDLEEETNMKLSELTLAQLREMRPELIAEIIEGAAPEPTIKEVTPPEVTLELALHRKSNAGAGSIVFAYLQEKVEKEEDLTEELLQEAREHAATQLFARHAPAPASNMKGDGSPAPDPVDKVEDKSGDDALTEEQREMISLSGGGRILDD